MDRINVDEWIRQSGLSKSSVASASGVSRSSIYRIQHGETDPSVGTLRELALACGLDLDIQLRPLSDPYAAQAAREMLEEGFIPDDRDQVRQWAHRFERASLNDPLEVVKYAGRASGLLSLAAPSVYLRGEIDDLRLASAADAAGGSWGLSGQPHLELGIGSPLSGMKVLWTEDPKLVAMMLTESMKAARSTLTASVILAKATPAVFQGSFLHHGVNFVAPIQAVIDGFSLGGTLASVAQEIAGEW